MKRVYDQIIELNYTNSNVLFLADLRRFFSSKRPNKVAQTFGQRDQWMAVANSATAGHTLVISKLYLATPQAMRAPPPPKGTGWSE